MTSPLSKYLGFRRWTRPVLSMLYYTYLDGVTDDIGSLLYLWYNRSAHLGISVHFQYRTSEVLRQDIKLYKTSHMSPLAFLDVGQRH